MADTITLTINDKQVTAKAGQTFHQRVSMSASGQPSISPADAEVVSDADTCPRSEPQLGQRGEHEGVPRVSGGLIPSPGGGRGRCSWISKQHFMATGQRRQGISQRST